MNLNTKLLTVQSREGEDYGKVIQHRKSPITLSGVEFHVQEGTLQTIRETGQRAVCAYALGTVTTEDPGDIGRPVRFNPFERDRFFFADQKQEAIEETSYLRAWIEETDEGRRPHMQAIDGSENL